MMTSLAWALSWADKRHALAAALVAFVALTAGCNRAVDVRASFPAPVVDPLPLSVGIHYPDKFRRYAFTDPDSRSSKWSIQLGAAQVLMMDTVFGRLFREIRPVDAVAPATGTGVDLVIEPTIEAFEYSLPSQSATEFYSVWIRYNLAVYRPDGSLVTRWPVSAYGQTDARKFNLDPADSMQTATRIALRDAAAMISLQLVEDSTFRAAFLGAQAPAPGPTPRPAETGEPSGVPPPPSARESENAA